MEFIEANGAKFLPSNDMILTWEKKTGLAFEPITREWIREKMGSERATFIDVGASTGFYSIPMALSGHRVISVEPNARVLERLHENIALNNLTGQIEIYPVALSNKVGSATFYTNPRVHLTSGGSIQAPTCHSPRREEVPTTTLDELHQGPVRLIKIDVENHERQVLEGALQTIRRERPFLLLEANTSGLRLPLLEILTSLQYVWELADERNILAEPRTW